MKNLLQRIYAKRGQEKLEIEAEFDRDFYLSRHPDVRLSGMDPLKHYVIHGWREGRDPSPNFSTKRYLSSYPQLRDGEVDPLTHYVREGRSGNYSPKSRSELDEPEYSSEAAAAPYFHRDFYLENNKDIRDAGIDPYRHFMQFGWREHRDPSALFSTKYYIETNPDIKLSGLNPLQHFLQYGRDEGRAALKYSDSLKHIDVRLSVTVIIPNYNHERFLRERIESILSQSYRNFKIIILDDCSTDDSRDVIIKYKSEFPDIIECIFNEQNSGSVFNQWQKGIESAKGDIIWVCESDDYCDSNFLERAIAAFADESVMISFGRIQFANQSGDVIEGLDGYREQSQLGIWAQDFSKPAAEMFCGAFGNTNVIPNVGGCLFRKQKISQDEWSVAKSFKILGDWYLYLILSRGGKIAYIKEAVAYFRQHGSNTSVKSFKSEHYYREHAAINELIRKYWGGSGRNTYHLFERCAEQYRMFGNDAMLPPLGAMYDVPAILGVVRSKKHILICILGFELGGGELFPIFLANELLRSGHLVSVGVLKNGSGLEKIRAQLDARIAVYRVNDILERGVSHFVQEAGVDLIHSHYIGTEYALLKNLTGQLEIPYIVTLHGSYESADIKDDFLLRLIRNVKCWVYLTSRNLKHLEGLPLDSSVLQQIPNGVPKLFSPRISRQDFGIEDNAFVFAVASRAISEKGWRETIAAFRIIQSQSEEPLHLILCGTGPIYEELMGEDLENTIHLLGFRDDVDSIYDLSDVVILATRFSGESYPLALIQAMQAGKPIVSTDVGEIRAMLSVENDLAGILVNPENDNGKFINALAEAMDSIRQPLAYHQASSLSQSLGAQYDIENVASRYLEIYRREWQRIAEVENLNAL